MTEPEKSEDPADRPRRGLAVAAVSVAVVSLVLAISTWAAWLLVRPRVLGFPGNAFLGQVFLLVLGALWFVALLAGALAIVFGITGGAREHDGDLARAGALTGALTCLVAIAGAVTFALSPTWTPPVVTFQNTPGVYGNYFGGGSK
ncbi:hypothetical protein [Amycolatopsis saalfeldensis]|uniref:Uncharacterized protein n=1 Tax=Amycolatopsis saalfeldensis TaxID=394193 RepID=A0A1H8XVT1_9PSEU|nr:hypothetical protein [Amycolatopsis saalfeldensis]SEP44154.1 hypothetical protein SAMN04489732_109181 [Amycolatopsis saalfeldensis]